MALFARPPLLAAEWLQMHLANPEVVVLDATFFLPKQNQDAKKDFQQQHIRGAGFFDIDTIANDDSPLPHMLPNAQQFAKAVGGLGIDNESRVVVYDNNGYMASARAWWMFRVFGHEDVFVLDGGLTGWKAGGGPLQSGITEAQPRQYDARFRSDLVCNLGQMKITASTRSRQIIDARSPGRFSGVEVEARPGLRSGHIPGSLNLHYGLFAEKKTGNFRSKDELATLFQSVGIDLDRPMVTTCGSGVTAAILALGLFVLERHNVPVYDGSWTEWGGKRDTPIATGSV